MFNQQNTAGCVPAHRKQFRGHYPFGRSMGLRRPKYNVPLNIIDNENEYIVHVFAVGFAKEDVKISTIGDVLYISGSKTIDEEKTPEFSWQEFPIKNFERTLTLNGKVAIDNISAKSENGILIITLPKNEEAIKKEQTITVQ
jgi:HSP20 family protein